LQKIPAKQIQQKINQINSDIKLLKNKVVNLKSTKDLALTNNTPNELSNIKQSTGNLILETPFLTQLYPFYVNHKGLHTKIMGKTISFKFLSTTKHRKITSLQSSSTHTIHLKQNLINSLKNELSYLRIDEQLQKPDIQAKILEIEQIIKTKICSNLPNAFWERKQHIITLPYEKDFNERQIPTKARTSNTNEC